ncbi:MAG TPA: NAD(P)H-dependent oxidoreductase subunit E [Salinivirgaceae bacterium]|nr:NAD(P)H-dependent oxidoreductase subunit E [Salinivirgaceae bacterium]
MAKELKISAAILLGGKSSRMKGFDKSKLLIDNEPILSRTMNVLVPMFDEVLIVSNQTFENRTNESVKLVSDRIPGHGPLSGIHAAIENSSNPWCFVIACDMPLIQSGSIEILIKEISAEIDAIIPVHSKGIEPLHAVYSKSVLFTLENHLKNCSSNKISLFLENIRTKYIQYESSLSFINLNTFNDLKNLKHQIAMTYQPEAIIRRYPPRREFLLKMLTDLQNTNPQNYLSSDAIDAVVQYTGLSKAAVMGVVEYYSLFSSKPRGKYIVRVCQSVVCSSKESEGILKALNEAFSISEIGQTSADGLVTIEHTECLGHCHEGPVVSVNHQILPSPTAQSVVHQVQQIIKNSEL